jgi:hypothetical protein
MKYSSITGQEPTIPLTDDHMDGTWLTTDLYVGEIFFNSADNKAWFRSENGIVPLGGSGSGTYSFIGDYVHISGGTYSGVVYAPTFSANGITASYIIADTYDGGTFNGVFVGDGSGLTGINANWLGGTISNPSQFLNDFTLTGNTYFDGVISSNNSEITYDKNINLTSGAGVSASFFIGDGSQLTNLPVGTYSDIYTLGATISGYTINFERNNSTNYSVDLTEMFGTNSNVSGTYWDGTTNEFSIDFADGTSITTPIDTFNNLSLFGSLNATDVYANNFYGTFNGTYSNDIYTTSANLYGNDLVFDRTDGASYSVSLSSLIFSGPTGSTGATGATGSNGLTPYMVISYNSTGLTLATGSVTLPITTTLLIGWSQGTRLRIWNDATHYMEGQITTAMTYPQVAGNNINVNIDYVVGTGTLAVWRVGVAGDVGATGTASQTLAQTLVIGNNTGNNDIELNNSTFTSTSDSIKAFGNTMADAKFSFEDLGGGGWAPTIRTQNGNSTNYITVQDSETYIYNGQSDAFVNRYGQIDVGPTQITTNVSNLNTGENTEFIMTSTGIDNKAVGSTPGNQSRLTMDQYETIMKTSITDVDNMDAYQRNWANPSQIGSQLRAFNNTLGYSSTIEAQYDGSHIQNILTATDGTETTFISQRHYEMVVSGSLASFKGIEYLNDYSTNYSSRSLVDKQYVDLAVSGVGTGATGATGPAGATGPTGPSGGLGTYSVISAFGITGSDYTNITATGSWNNSTGIYTGPAITTSYQGQMTYNDDYLFIMGTDTYPIRLIRG